MNDVDVCVIGGSCTGVFAAVRAARLGAKVCIIEKNNCFGGAATAGFVCIWHSLDNTRGEFPVIGGLTKEILDRLDGMKALGSPRQPKNGEIELCQFERAFNSEELKIELDYLIQEHNVIPYLHTVFCGAQYENRHITSIIVENKSGRAAITAKCFIDATGDGDLAYYLGVTSYVHKGSMQPPTPCFKFFGLNYSPEFSLSKALDMHGEEFGLRKDHGWSVDIPDCPEITMSAQTHIYNVDCSDAEQLTFAEMEGRRHARAIHNTIKKYASQGLRTALVACSSNIGIRETRHFASLHKLRESEILNGTRFPDAIANGTYRVDIHHSGNHAGVTFRYLNGMEEVIENRGSHVLRRKWREENNDVSPTFYQIPYRTLLTAEYDNLLLAGRMIDADMGAFGAVRVMVNLNQLGEAAGVAAYIAASGNTKVEDVDTGKLRSLLKSGGSCIF